MDMAKWKRSKPFVEGSCVSDPCWYAVPGATGKEVIIFDLYPGTGMSFQCQESDRHSIPYAAATNILAKDIIGVTETLSPTRVMCNASTVSSELSSSDSAY